MDNPLLSLDLFLELSYKFYIFAKMKAIYKITNLVNGKFYLGSSKNINKRKSVHFSSLRYNKHHCLYLQRAYNKYGKENFRFEIIKECKDCLREEQEYLDTLDWNSCYNVSKFAGGGDNISNHPNKNEIIKKLIQILDENRYKISPRFKEDNNNWKGGISKKLCISCKLEIPSSNKSKCKNCYFSERNYNGSSNPFYNKSHSIETKQLLSKINKERGYIGSQEKAVIIDNKEYKSISFAARELNISPNTIINRIRNNKFPNYKYK